MSSPESAGTAADRALSSAGAILGRRLYDPKRHLFGQRRWFLRRDYEYLWPFANAWSASGALASLPEAVRLDPDRPDAALDPTVALSWFLDGLPAYHRTGHAVFDGSGPVGFESGVVPPLSNGGDVYFDDNAWIGLASMHQYQVTGDERSLELAQRIYDFVLLGWSTETGWSHPGGIRWKVPLSNRSRNACSNGPVSALAALVHRHTGRGDALEWTVRIYDWVRGTLLRDDDLYDDQIAPDGSRNTTVWSYNQGSMIGAGVVLAEITNDQSYLDHARGTAAASTARFTVGALVEQGAAFNAVYFRNLFLLDQAVADASYHRSAAAYGDDQWAHARDPATGLFGGGGSPLNRSAPMVEIYALLAGARPHP